MTIRTPATTALDRQHVAYTLHPYQVPADAPDYGRVVADALGLDPAQVFKTLIAELDGALAAAERATGYVRGGISPFGQRKRLPAVVDASATGFDTIYVSAGRRGLQVALAPAELLRVTGATVAPIGRPA